MNEKYVFQDIVLIDYFEIKQFNTSRFSQSENESY